MKAFGKMIVRYTIVQTIFFIIALPFFLLPRWIHFKLLYPIFIKLYLFAPKIRVHNISKNKIIREKNIIIASNHKSFADFCYIAKYLRVPFTLIAKMEAFNQNVFFKIIEWKMSIIPVDRKSTVSHIAAIERAKEMILKKKYSLIIFPEGWYNIDVPVGELKNGIAKLAEETKVKLLPAAIYGITNKFLEEKNLKWKDVYIKFGDFISFDDYCGREEFLKALKSKIEKLHNEILDYLK